jgi:hypothetical protein
MHELSGTSLVGWHVGVHPRVAGLRVRSLDRVDIALGEALRLEMADGEAAAADPIHLQYYVVTDVGPWALWISCNRDDAAGHEAALAAIRPPFSGESEG